jgi:hypothetical protein
MSYERRPPSWKRLSEDQRIKNFRRSSDGKNQSPEQAIDSMQKKLASRFGVHLDDMGMARLFMDIVHDRLKEVAKQRLKHWDMEFIQQCAHILRNKSLQSNSTAPGKSLSENVPPHVHLTKAHEKALEQPDTCQP